MKVTEPIGIPSGWEILAAGVCGSMKHKYWMKYLNQHLSSKNYIPFGWYWIIYNWKVTS